MNEIIIIGGGLAGCEAAWQIAEHGKNVRLLEMKPDKKSPAHKSNTLAELVCSNSLRSDDPTTAVGLLKREMTTLGSLFIETARQTAVPAGRALAVDREKFTHQITKTITTHPNIVVERREVTEIPPASEGLTILATGPLTSTPMAESLANFTGRDRLFFYDAIAPIVYQDSLNMNIVYSKSRYEDGPGDYLNCPMTKEQYLHFISELEAAEYVPLHEFEEAKYFEGCLPIEIMCQRGAETLRFGPMKPVGLPTPDGDEPYAVIQLRKENSAGTAYNMVGFQTKLTYPEQRRIFRQIPGMEEVEFARFGSIHRNTFIIAPEILQPTLQCIKNDHILLAGQLTGVEGYVESAAMGLLAGLNSIRITQQKSPVIPPTETALGALIRHLTTTEPKHFQPSNVNFGLFPPLGKKIRKKFRGKERAHRSATAIQQWLTTF